MKEQTIATTSEQYALESIDNSFYPDFLRVRPTDLYFNILLFYWVYYFSFIRSF